MAIICFVASKSGGHIIPCITLAHQIQQKCPETKIIFFTGNQPLDQQLTCSSHIDQTIMLPVGSVRISKLKYLLLAYQLSIAFVLSLYHLLRTRPEKIISTGGVIAVPVCCAARLLQIPIELHELNVIPGKAVHYLSTISDTVHISFAVTQQYFGRKHCIVSGYPLRFTPEQQTVLPEHARAQFGLQEQVPTVVLLGGSQGSQFLNHLMQQVVPHVTQNIQIIHQTGAHDVQQMRQWYHHVGIPAYVCSYEPRAHLLYAAAAVIICRAGAGTLHEALFFKKPCITIPLVTNNTDHQWHNAIACAQLYPHMIHVIAQHNARTHPEQISTLIMSFLPQATL